MKVRTLLFMGLLMVISPLLQAEMDHALVIKGPFKTATDVTLACLECHEQQADDFMKTQHWTWVDKQQVPGRGIIEFGKKNAINNFCIGLPSNWPRCTSCHAGYGWKDDSFDFNKAENVDCLVCHDTTGSYRKFPVGSGHPVYEEKEFPPGSGKLWKPLNLLEIAQKVGPTSRKSCGSCHFFGGGGDHVKHGDLDSSLIDPERRIDVHMGSDGGNMNCSDCHKTRQHAISGEAVSVTVSDKGKTLDCADCHTKTPHKDKFKAVYDKHSNKVACQTCHIPTFSRMLPTKVWWDWSKAGDKQRQVDKDQYRMPLYDFKKGEFKWDKDIVPTYEWFDGSVDRYIAGDKIDPEKITHLSRPRGNKDQQGAKITPFKIMRGIQPYDQGTGMFVIPKLLGGYWNHYDWNKASEEGMKVAGLPYKGPVGFAQTDMHWEITHMVVPKQQALGCVDCHSNNGVMDWQYLGYDEDPLKAKKKKK